MTEAKNKPITSLIDTVESNKLIADYTTSVFTKEALEAQLERLKIARQKKADFKAKNAALYEQEKELNESEKTARRTVYAMLAQAAQHMELAEFEAFRKEMLEGLGYQPKYEVHGDDAAIRNWCIEHAPYFLEVNRRLFDVMVKSMDEMADYVPRPSAMPPATVVECILPTISDKLPAPTPAADAKADETIES